MGNEHRAIVRPQLCWRRIQLEQLQDRVDYFQGLTAASHLNHQAGPAELVDHVQEPERAAMHRQVELEVDRPGVVRVFSPQEFLAAVSRSRTLLLTRQCPL